MTLGPHARRRPAARRRAGRAAGAALALLAALLAGCAARGPRVVVGYAGAPQGLAADDLAALRGRRIAVDPGHGGAFPGARGRRGLAEAEVNLAVALHLRDALRAAGAEVTLTRDTDRDFLSPADSSLRADLAERVRIVNAARPEAFVSIHHNAQPDGRREVNETLTFYRLGDDGPSLDLADRVHRALVRGVGIRPHRVVPGNFAVLRGVEAPAILTETSHLSHPKVERRLALDRARRLEAESIARGLAAFFARGAPEVETLWTESSAGRAAVRARVRGAFDRVELRVGGVPVVPRVTGSEIAWESPADAPAGPLPVTLRVGLSGRGVSATARAEAVIERPWNAFYLETELWPARLPAAGGPAAARLLAVDAWGGRAPAALAVRVTAHDTADAPRDTLLRFADGEAWLPLRIAPRAPGAGPATFTARVVPPDGATAYPPEAPLVVPIAAPGEPARAAIALRLAPGDSALRPLARERAERGRLRRAAVAFPREAADWVTPLGLAAPPESAAGRGAPALRGFRPWAADSAGTLPTRWSAIAGGALHGRRIAIDPDGGGDAAGGAGPGGARGAALSLEVARALAAMLEAAGAEVRLTREGDAPVPEVERVLAAERFGAERYVRIGHRAEPPQLGHYFSSAAGRRWAERAARELARLGLPAPPVGDNAHYPVQHTSAVALWAGLARVDDPREEQRLASPGTLRAEAYALFLALAREWAGEAEWPIVTHTVRDANGRPLAGAAVTVGGWLLLESDARGEVRFARTEPGPVELRVEHPAARGRTVLLDSPAVAVPTGPHGR
uniref:MurNAc-LAA domain-containing protein n=1 Tax=Eiseniibacteriota bacterium TaxID=2212470 RepID=A0A832MLY5_UNCEI